VASMCLRLEGNEYFKKSAHVVLLSSQDISYVKLQIVMAGCWVNLVCTGKRTL